jgi:hypothetical protein
MQEQQLKHSRQCLASSWLHHASRYIQTVAVLLLLLAVGGCRDAKVSVVEWNADLHCLKNGSLHSYEKPELREGCPGACSIGAGAFAGTSKLV